MSASTPQSQLDSHQDERRQGPEDRRTAGEDRRNLDRVLEDFAPRRNPDMRDRRSR